MRNQIVSLGKDTLIYGIGSVLLRFISILTLPLFTSYLSPESYGVLAMVGFLGMVIQPIFGLGISAAMGPNYFEKDDFFEKSKVVWSSFVICLISVIILVFISFFFSPFIGQLILLPSKYTSCITLSLFGCVFTILASPFVQRVQFEKKVFFYISVVLGCSILSILLSIYLVVYKSQGVVGMLWGQLLGNFTMFVAFMFAAIRSTKISISDKLIKSLLRLGLPLVPSFALLFVLMHSNKYILKWLIGLDAVGIYSVGFSFGMTISIVTTGIATAWYPFFMGYANRQNEARILFGRVTSYYILGVGFLCLIFFLFANPILTLLSQNSFHQAYIVIGNVAVANFAQTLFNFFLPGLYFNKEIRYVSLIQGTAALLSIPINYLLIKQYSILGAGIGLAIGNLLMAGLMYCWIFFNQEKYIKVEYEWKRIILFICLSIIIIITHILLPTLKLKGEIIKSIILSCATLLGIIVLLSKQEKQFLLKKINS